MTTIIYGIPNCDTIRKARKWLETHNVSYQFHDVRKDGMDKSTLQQWVKLVGWETLLNRRGTTWRQLPDNAKLNVDESSAVELMAENPAIIKRPVLNKAGELRVGFSEADYKALFF